MNFETSVNNYPLDTPIHPGEFESVFSTLELSSQQILSPEATICDNVSIRRFMSNVGFHSIAGITGSNPAGGMDVCLSVVCCAGRGLCDWRIPRREGCN